MICISIIIFHLHVWQLRLSRIIVRRSFWPSICPICTRIFHVFSFVVVNWLRRIPTTSIVIKIGRLPHCCFLFKLRLSDGGIPQIWVSLSGSCIPLVWKQKLRLDIVNTCVRIIQVFNSFSLLCYLLLVIVGLFSNAQEQLVDVFQRECWSLYVFYSFTRINPISKHLSSIYLTVVFLSNIILVANQNNRDHHLIVLTAVDVNTSDAV